MKRIAAFFAVGAMMLALGTVESQAGGKQKFEPNQEISSKTGKWKSAIREQPVKMIGCTVKRVSGGDDTYINFRFGDDGSTFPAGQRFYLTTDERVSLKVPANGQLPGNKPLVINAYNGTVKIIYITVHFQ